MRAIKIDPFARTVTEEDITDVSPSALCAEVGAQSLDFSGLGSMVVAVVDDLGLYRKDQRYWYFDLPGGKALMAGKAIILSRDFEGEIVGLDPRAGLDFTQSIVRWAGDAAMAEEAIVAGLVNRPTVAVNGDVIWAWSPASEGTKP